jgi:hypothetical protein
LRIARGSGDHRDFAPRKSRIWFSVAALTSMPGKYRAFGDLAGTVKIRITA